jgi:hypothetical protein
MECIRLGVDALAYLLASPFPTQATQTPVFTRELNRLLDDALREQAPVSPEMAVVPYSRIGDWLVGA